jgi:phosphohistidine phosphatase SixA
MMNLARQITFCSVVILGLVAATGRAQTLSGSTLTQALQRGGYVIVMRHASSPQTPPNPEDAVPGNTKIERQLDQDGIDSAKQMGASLRKLGIPIGTVYSSPAFRAMETVYYAKLGNAISVPELGDHGMSMAGTDATQTAWLQGAVKHFEAGKNVFLVTHMPNITAAFPSQAAGVKDGEGLVFGPDGNGGARLVARVGIAEWTNLRN